MGSEKQWFTIECSDKMREKGKFDKMITNDVFEY